MNEIEVIPFYTKDAERTVRQIIRDTEDEIRELDSIQSDLDKPVNQLPSTDNFRKEWKKMSKPSEEFDFYQERLQQIMDDYGINDIVYADMYDDLSMVAENRQAAGNVVQALRVNDAMSPVLAGSLNKLLEDSKAARREQLKAFENEQNSLEDYIHELDEVVTGFEDMNRYTLPLESVDQALDFWEQLESFEDRTERMRAERQNDYKAEEYNTVNLYGFFQDIYGEDIGVEQPVMRDLQAVDSRVDEAKDNIVF